MSHFSTVKTELRDRQALVEALHDLGFPPLEGAQPVRGYRGQTVTADLAIPQAVNSFCPASNQSTRNADGIVDLGKRLHNLHCTSYKELDT